MLDEELTAVRYISFPRLGEGGLRKDGTHWTHRLTESTANAFVRVNEELSIPLIDAVDRAHIHTGSVLDANARLSNHIHHAPSYLSARATPAGTVAVIPDPRRCQYQ
jgi:hypothetical protein